MTGFIDGVQRSQTPLRPDRLGDWIGEDDLVRAVGPSVDELDLPALGFGRAVAARTRRPGYHSATLLKLVVYGYLHRILQPPARERWCHRRQAKIKTVNNRDRNFTRGKIASRLWTPRTNATSMRWCASTGRGDTETYLLAAHEVTIQGFDRDQEGVTAR